MADQQIVEGLSQTSFSEAAQDAAKQIKELRDDQLVRFKVAEATVDVGGNAGVTTYRVALERSA